MRIRAVIVRSRRVGPVLDVDQPADHRERVLQIDAVAVGNFCRGGNADGSGLGAGNRCSAKFGQGVEKFGGHFVRNKRGDEGRLLQLVDGILDLNSPDVRCRVRHQFWQFHLAPR